MENENLKPGTAKTVSFKVGPEHSAKKAGSGDLDVLATPFMVAFMENAAMLLTAPALPEGSTTVGTKIEVSHIRATPVGDTVNARAELAETDGRRLVFRVMASDSKGSIGEGKHERFIVDKERFLSKL